MILRQWMNKSKELSEKRIEMLADKFTIKELIEYRDNYIENQKIIRNVASVLVAVCLCMIIVACMLNELTVISDGDFNLSFGYLFGLSVFTMLFAYPTGSYPQKLTAAIEKKCLSEMEEKI